MAVTDFYVTLKENSYSVANNTSSVTIKVYIKTTNSYNQTGGASGSITLGGNASGKYTFKKSFPSYATTLLYSKTVTVTHNSDGTGKITVSAKFNTQISAGTVSASKSLTLTTIPRASVPTATGTPQLGNTITINTNRKSSAFTHTITWNWAGKSGTIGTGVGASTTWTPSVETFAPYLTNAASATCTITCTTYNGSQNIGSKTVSFTLSVPATVKPSISDVVITDLEGLKDNYGAFITGGYSKPNAVITAASMYGATISSYKLALAAVNASSTTGTVTINSIPTITQTTQTQTLTVTVTDTRGRTATWTQEVLVANYVPISLTTITARRWNVEDNVEDDESTTVKVVVAGALFRVNGAGTTTATLVVEYRERTSETATYTTHASVDINNDFNNSFNIENLDSAKTYEIRVTITDAFGVVTQNSLYIPTAQPVIDLRSTGRGIGFGTVAIDDTFRVGMQANFMNPASFAGAASFADVASFAGAVDFEALLKAANHIALLNNSALAAYLAGNESMTSILRMNPSNQVELNWTSGGLKGRVSKTIWSGNASVGKTNFTVSELPYYNIILGKFSGRSAKCIYVRQEAGNPNSPFFGLSAYTGGTNITLYASAILCTGNKVTEIRSTNANWGGSANASGTLTDIEGVL